MIDDAEAAELKDAIAGCPMVVMSYTPPSRGIPANLSQILVSLGSAGAFTALYQVISKFLEKNKDRELTIERKGIKVVIKGHGLPEEYILLEMLAPELKAGRDEANPD